METRCEEGAASACRAVPIVPRERLLRRLRQDRGRVVFLCAPAGYGKSVLLDQWVAADGREPLRILLGPEHNDPVALVDSLTPLLDGGCPEGLAAALRTPALDIERGVVPPLLAALSRRPTPFILVLDQLERIESPDALLIIGALCRGMPAGSQLALSGRTEKWLRLGRLRAHGLLIELGREDLTMTKSECAAMLGALDVDLSGRPLDTLVLRTEGWPAALSLAGLALTRASDPGRAVTRFRGEDRVVGDYLREEFLSSLSSRRLSFLRRASVLDRLGGPLCDFVLAREDSATALRDLSRSNMLLSPIDRDGWFRIHPLLREALRADLRRVEPDAESELHRRASGWWQADGDHDLAVHHAIEAAATRSAGELIWDALPEYTSRGRNATVLNWLTRIGENEAAKNPHLSLSAAWAQLYRGRGAEAERWFAVTRRLLGGLEESERAATLRGGLHLGDAILARDGLAAAREAAAAAEVTLPEESPWRPVCALIDGVALHLLGERGEARRRLQEGARRGSVVAPSVQVICLAQLALLAIEGDDWHLAEREMSRAWMQIDGVSLRECPMSSLAISVSAFLRARRGRVDEARSDLAQGIRLLGDLDQFVSWYEVETRVMLARASHRLGDREGAVRLLRDAGSELLQVPEVTALDGWLEQAKAGFTVTPSDGEGVLTAAELRILQYLPTHLSVPQIAQAVLLSPNTVKTHVRGIYGKFGVSSRQAAIRHAREAGLLGEDERALPV